MVFCHGNSTHYKRQGGGCCGGETVKSMIVLPEDPGSNPSSHITA